MELGTLAPDYRLLTAAVALDLLFGDPAYALHPVRLMGNSLTWIESRLRQLGFDGYGGGVLLFLCLALLWVGGIAAVLTMAEKWSSAAAMSAQILLVYTLLALRDLAAHARDVQRAGSAGSLEGARRAIAKLVGRDTDRMDIAACRRAAMESLGENLADGFTSPLFWYVVAGVPGIVLFKVVSTMDSMVGYKTDRYLRFGWCGARLDDVMNYIPARLTWLLISLVAAVLPRCSAKKALQVGWQQHALLPGPNSGWSEAAVAGAVQRRLIGPIWSNGKLVTEAWLGLASDPPAGSDSDLRRTIYLALACGVAAAIFSVVAIALFQIDKK